MSGGPAVELTLTDAPRYAAELSDRELVARWLASADPAAFDGLIRRHVGLMRRAALVALGSAAGRDPACVDDAVQDACERLLSAFASYRGDSEPATFMASVARRAALDLLRKGLRHRAKLRRAAALAGPEAEAPEDPAGDAERRAAALGVMAALSVLPEPDRSLVYLRDAEGMELAGLAAAFSLPVGTVKSKLARSRLKLRERVLREWGRV